MGYMDLWLINQDNAPDHWPISNRYRIASQMANDEAHLNSILQCAFGDGVELRLVLAI